MSRPLCFDFPLSPDRRRPAQVVIPADLTKTEADRLCRFVQTLVAPKSAERATPREATWCQMVTQADQSDNKDQAGVNP